ncbi:MAG: cobalt-precorrin-5B (C(1))-methyltransferase CbiD [Chroococcales cyanobacterium]
MNNSSPRFGYTLPVFACASAIAALSCLRDNQSLESVSLALLTPPQIVEIPIEQVAKLSETMALAMTRSDSGDNLDLTHNTPVWALVEWNPQATEFITIRGGEGIGRQENGEGSAAIYRYAKQLLIENLTQLLQSNEKIQVTIILPEGRQLAQRTSNAAFGVVEGLSLLGTSGIAQPLSAPGQLELYQEELATKAKEFQDLVFCVGENGLDLARQMGINPQQLLKTANWLGSLLVAAAMESVSSILLLGYHGKLIKLAGGIFHTHSHLADGRLEILTAHCANAGLSTSQLQQIFASPTTESALQLLRQWEIEQGMSWVELVYEAIASTIDSRCQAYITKYSEKNVTVGSVLFDRDRKILVKSSNGTTLLSKMC